MQIWPFLAVVGVIVVTPGVDMALVTRNTLLHGRRVGLASALGVNAGVALWAACAALGLAALVASSARAFAVVQLAGATYLVIIGARSIWASFRAGDVPAASPTHDRLGLGAAFRQGVLSNALNPKVAVLFTSLLPQFVGDDASATDLLLLGGLINVLGLAWLTSYTLAVARARRLLERPSVRRGFDRASGTVLVALGLRLAFERRP